MLTQVVRKDGEGESGSKTCSYEIHRAGEERQRAAEMEAADRASVSI